MLLAVLFISLGSLAQTDTNSIVVHKDARLDLLVKKQIEINELTSRDARRFVPGFRILVISSNDRNKVMNAKAKLYQQYPALPSYLIYQAPFYKLKAGNFKDRAAADDFLSELQAFFPSGVYVIRDTVEVNPDKSAETEQP
jgi:hypothetical protein